ncbi:type IV pilin protein [Vitreoscilla stercoraria]|uniref:Prepilin-type N-terminal cleavage/methylation domain-containing protein n=1 Tax=Vitreoscilla stercoraria TaxID=61 RepID=A0ABY4E938_VITST|nr:prepilin-type N-terminal cleavage/methylation domain-containing protein [Vitreoscilla stercoraria]UOO91925.1 prepilin-type N-terminal cleavage/methylation domain-containing protein [Vitreoscilla stercoraria]
MSRLHQKGFSLTEMMVALVILGIIVGITLPLYSRHVENTRLTQARSVALQLQQELKVLKLRAGQITDAEIEAVNEKAVSLTTENNLTAFFEFEAALVGNKIFVSVTPLDTSKAGLYTDSTGEVFKCPDAASVAARSSCTKY